MFRAIKVRHALVHRNGKVGEEYVDVTKERVEKLAQEVDILVSSIAAQIKHLDDEDVPF